MKFNFENIGPGNNVTIIGNKVEGGVSKGPVIRINGKEFHSPEEADEYLKRQNPPKRGGSSRVGLTVNNIEGESEISIENQEEEVSNPEPETATPTQEPLTQGRSLEINRPGSTVRIGRMDDKSRVFIDGVRVDSPESSDTSVSPEEDISGDVTIESRVRTKDRTIASGTEPVRSEEPERKASNDINRTTESEDVGVSEKYVSLDDINVTVSNLPRSEEEKRRKEWPVDDKKRRAESAVESMEVISLPMTPEMKEAVEENFFYVAREYFQGYGIDFKLPRIIILPKKIDDGTAARIRGLEHHQIDYLVDMEDSAHGVVFGAGLAIVRERDFGENETFRQLHTLGNIVHECRHAMSQDSFRIEDWNFPTRSAKRDRFGLGYHKAIAEKLEQQDSLTKDAVSALEEGVVTLFQYDMMREILERGLPFFDNPSEELRDIEDNFFTEGQAWGTYYNNLLVRISNDLNVPVESLRVAGLQRVETNSDDIDFKFAESYPNSVAMVKFIREKLEEKNVDFGRLAARASVKGEMLAFWRAIADVFGKDMIREIATATEDDADKVLEKLKQKVPSEPSGNPIVG